MENDFSVLMSVYRNDSPIYLKEAIRSVSIRQTLQPSEIVLVIDGPVPDAINNAITEVKSEVHYLKIVVLPENGGLGNALRIGVPHCSHEFIARMDSDDIAFPDRFEKQIAFMDINPDIAVVGGLIAEFIDSPDNIVGYRNVPLTPLDCRKYYQDRDPLNHMAVMFRKSAILDVGNYQSWHLDEDTYLWGRLLEKGYKLANLPDILVNVRVGEAMYGRRGGWKYFKSDTKILKWKLEHGLTTKGRYWYNYLGRFAVQVLMPNCLRSFIYKKCLRSKKNC